MSKPWLCTTCVKRRRCLKHFIVWLLGIAKYVHSTNCYEPEWKTTYRNSNGTMKDCSTCKYCDEDFYYNDETGEEYSVYNCQKGNDTSLDYKCKDFEQYKPQKYIEKYTKCDKCEYFKECQEYLIETTDCLDENKHYINGMGHVCRIDELEQ